MSSSTSEEQIYKKRKKQTHKPTEDLERLFSSESVSEEEEQIYYPTDNYMLQEIFGTGDEYSYIYKSVKDTSKDTTKEIITMKDNITTSQTSEFFYDSDEVFYFLTNRTLLTEKEKQTLKMLLHGYSPFFIFFHCDSSYIFFELVEFKNKLKDFVAVRSERARFVDNKEELDAVVKYNKAVDNNTNTINRKFLVVSEVLLSVESFYENYFNSHRINEPVDLDMGYEDFLRQSCFGREDMLIDCVSTEYSGHPLFVKVIVDFYYRYGKINDKYIHCNDDKDDNMDNYNTDNNNTDNNTNNNIIVTDEDFNILTQYFTNSNTYNTLRLKILRSSISKIQNLKRKIITKQSKERKKQVKQLLVNNILDKIINGKREIKEYDVVFGMVEIKNVYHVSIVDYRGKNQGYYIIKDINALNDKFSEFKPVFLAVCGVEKGFKYGLMKLKENIKEYLLNNNDNSFNNTLDVIVTENEIVNKLYSFKDLKSYTTGIARRVINTELEFIKILTEKINIKYINNQETLSFEESLKCLEQGIKLSIAFTGIEVNKLVLPEYSNVLPLLNLDSYFVEQMESYGEAVSLENLKKTGILVQRQEKENYFYINTFINDYDNACCFLRIKDAKNILDSYMIHPKNYGLTKILCDSVLENTNNNEVLRIDTEKLKNIDFKYVQHDTKELENVRNYLLCTKREEFNSVPDMTIFKEIIGIIKMKEYEGRVKNEFGSFYLVEISVCEDDYVVKPLFKSNGFIDCYIKKDTYNDNKSECFVNQICRVRVNDMYVSSFGYKGVMVKKEKDERVRVVEHFLFGKYNAKEAEDVLRGGRVVCLRRSFKDNSLIVVVKIDTCKINKNNGIEDNINNTSTNYMNNMNNNNIVLDPVFIHLKIEEKEKNFIIQNKPYQSIDELISIHIRKIILLTNKIKEHEKYYETESETEQKIKNIQSKNVSYGFTFSRKYPGRVVFMYCRGGNVCCEYLKLGDKLYYEGSGFVSLEDFVNFRKRM